MAGILWPACWFFVPKASLRTCILLVLFRDVGPSVDIWLFGSHFKKRGGGGVRRLTLRGSMTNASLHFDDGRDLRHSKNVSADKKFPIPGRLLSTFFLFPVDVSDLSFV